MLQGAVREGFAVRTAALDVKEQQLWSNLPSHERLCFNSGSALSCVTLAKLLKHSATFFYFVKYRR